MPVFDWRSAMDQIIKLVKTYRLTPALDQRLRLAEQIFQQIEPQLRFFVFGTLTHPAAQDVLQETLKAVTVSLTTFFQGAGVVPSSQSRTRSSETGSRPKPG